MWRSYLVNLRPSFLNMLLQGANRIGGELKTTLVDSSFVASTSHFEWFDANCDSPFLTLVLLNCNVACKATMPTSRQAVQVIPCMIAIVNDIGTSTVEAMHSLTTKHSLCERAFSLQIPTCLLHLGPLVKLAKSH